MQTEIKESLKNTARGRKADEILRKCVHCGFCSATCPTYQVLGDERDGPRGRIYLIKSLFEGKAEKDIVYTHLDRCLTCRSCETSCPSGVEYGHLLDVGREQLAAENAGPGLCQGFYRYALRKVLTTRSLFKPALALARLFKPLLPASYQTKIPERNNAKEKYIVSNHERKVILFQGCVQGDLTPVTNEQTKRLLDRIKVEAITVSNEQCCGALSHHLSATAEAKAFIRKNIDAWWPYIEAGAEAIINTASGCGVMLKDYAYLMQDDKEYADKAKKIAALSMDIVEFLQVQDVSQLSLVAEMKDKRIAFHPPCTLQHGQKLQGKVEILLARLGVNLVPFPDSHLCCGSAGTYSLLQTDIATELQSRKIEAINSAKPDCIVTANIGCQMHLQEASDVPVKHWLELLAD